MPLLLLIFSFALRLSLISQGPFHLDCLDLALKAKETLRTHELHFLFGFGYPLTVILGAFFIFIFQGYGITVPVIAVNFMSVTISSLCIIPFYKVTQKLFNPQAAFFGSLLFCAWPLFLGVSVYGSSHPPTIFFLLWTVYFLLCFLETQRRRFLIVSSLAFGLMGANRIQDMILMSAAISVLYFFGTKEHPAQGKFLQRLKMFVPAVGLASLTAILFHLPLFFNPQYQPQLNRFAHMGLWDNFSGLFSPYLWLAKNWLIESLSPLGFILSFIGLAFLITKDKRKALFLFLGFAGPFLFYANILTSAPRFLILPSLALVISLGYCFSELIRLKKSIAGFSLGAFFIIFCFMGHSIFPVLLFRHQHALLPDYVRWTAAQTETNSMIIVSGDTSRFFQYYGPRQVLGRPQGLTDLPPEDLLNFKNKLDQTLLKKIPVYITSTGLWAYNPNQKFSRFMQYHYQLQYIGRAKTEDWHQGELTLQVGWQALFKILPR